MPSALPALCLRCETAACHRLAAGELNLTPLSAMVPPGHDSPCQQMGNRIQPSDGTGKHLGGGENLAPAWGKTPTAIAALQRSDSSAKHRCAPGLAAAILVSPPPPGEDMEAAPAMAAVWLPASTAGAGMPIAVRQPGWGHGGCMGGSCSGASWVPTATLPRSSGHLGLAAGMRCMWDQACRGVGRTRACRCAAGKQ